MIFDRLEILRKTMCEENGTDFPFHVAKISYIQNSRDFPHNLTMNTLQLLLSRKQVSHGIQMSRGELGMFSIDLVI
jgi:hypothetical protein